MAWGQRALGFEPYKRVSREKVEPSPNKVLAVCRLLVMPPPALRACGQKHHGA